jgi:hypothetical protein
MRRVRPRGIAVVVIELPHLVGADLSSAPEARDDLSALEPADELAPAAKMSWAVSLSLTAVTNQPLASLLAALDRSGFPSSSAICGITSYRPQIGGEAAKCGFSA